MKLLTSFMLATAIAIVSANDTNSSLSTEGSGVSTTKSGSESGSSNGASLDTVGSTSHEIHINADSTSSSGSTDIEAGDTNKGSIVGSNEEDYSIEYASGDDSTDNYTDSSSASETEDDTTGTSGSVDASSSHGKSGSAPIALYTSVAATAVAMVTAVLL